MSESWFYYNGLGTAQDLKSAKHWYRRSAHLGQLAYDAKTFEGAR